MSRRLTRRTALLRTLLLPGLALSGCALFDNSPESLPNRVFKLPQVGLPPDSIQLDVVYVQRPVGDALLGDKLWRYADELAAVESEHRDVLKQNGIRAGVIGSNPPPALQRMLGLKSDFAYEPEAEKTKQLVGHRYIIRSKGQQVIQTSPVPYPACTLEMQTGKETRTRSFENAMCQYRVTAERVQDGWVQLDFVPQVHHDQEKLRYTVGAENWQFESAQKTETMFAQRFGLRLSVGEMAVLTAADNAEGTLGRLFFIGPEDEPDLQRVLIIRLAGMSAPDLPPAVSQ